MYLIENLNVKPKFRSHLYSVYTTPPHSSERQARVFHSFSFSSQKSKSEQASMENAAAATPAQLSQKEKDIQMMLASHVHLGTKNIDFQMERYVFKRRSDGWFFCLFFTFSLLGFCYWFWLLVTVELIGCPILQYPCNILTLIHYW